MKNILLIFLCAVLSGCASAPRQPQVEGLTGMAAVVLERRDRDPRTFSMIDAIVFFPPSPYRYVRRMNGDHVLVLNTTEKAREAELVTADTLPKYAGLIRDNDLSRRSVDGGVLVYTPVAKPTFVFFNRDPQGELELQVRERLQPEETPRFEPLEPEIK
jgi:hypothetical protein